MAACSGKRATSAAVRQWSVTRAAAFLINARAWITAGTGHPMARFSGERWVLGAPLGRRRAPIDGAQAIRISVARGVLRGAYPAV